MSATMTRGASSSGRQTMRHLGLAATTGAVLVGAPTMAYYMKFIRPRHVYDRRVAELAAVPRPLRQTPRFVAGEEPMKSLEQAALQMEIDLHHRGLARLWFKTMIPFYVLVAMRMVTLVLRSIPVMSRYVAAKYSVFGATYGSAHQSLVALLATMGPSFIKLGQWAATRPDLFPPDLCDALSELFDQAPPHSWADTKAALDAAGIIDFFADIDRKPLNSGSVAQVHRAVLKHDFKVKASDVDEGALAALGVLPTTWSIDSAGGAATSRTSAASLRAWVPRNIANAWEKLSGSGGGGQGADRSSPSVAPAEAGDDGYVVCPAGTPVVLKVLHPGVRTLILADSMAMRSIGRFLTFVIPNSEFMSMEQTAEEVCGLAISQLNLKREAENLMEFRFNFRTTADDDSTNQISFPVPLMKLCSPDVLVETFETGERLNDANAGTYREAGALAMQMFMKMLFQDNLVHADLHPGNLLFRIRNPDGSLATSRSPDSDVAPGAVPQIVVLDPGLVTSLSEKERKNFISLFAAVISGDGELGAQLMYDNGPGKKVCRNLDQYRRDMGQVFDSLSPAKLGTFKLTNVDIGAKFTEVMEVMREHQVRIDMNFATLVATVVVGEGLGKRLVPDFNFVEHAVPFLVQCLRSHEMNYLVAKVQETYLTAGMGNI